MNKATSRGARAAALLLSVVCAQAFGASGIDPLCDETADSSASLQVAVEEFSVEVVDHGGSSEVAAIHSTVPASAVPVLQPQSPSVDVILRRIFDESTPRSPAIAQSDIDRLAIAAPLIEHAVPGQDEIPADAIDADASDAADKGEAVGIHARFPDLSDADTQRYRQQMFRTDI